MRVSLLLVLVALLSGCADWPQNPQEFRERVRQNPFHSVDTFEVARPLNDVAATMNKKSAECLRVRVKLSREHVAGITTDAGTVTFKPTFVLHANHAELYVQRKHEGTNEHEVGQVPPDGNYRVLMDATAVSASRTRIDVYRMTVNGTDENMRNAFMHWAKGDNLGCPVML